MKHVFYYYYYIIITGLLLPTIFSSAISQGVGEKKIPPEKKSPHRVENDTKIHHNFCTTFFKKRASNKITKYRLKS